MGFQRVIHDGLTFTSRTTAGGEEFLEARGVMIEDSEESAWYIWKNSGRGAWEKIRVFWENHVISQSLSHVWMWELDYKISWAPKNWCFWTVVVEKTLESPLDCKEIQPVHPKGNRSWMFIGRTDVEAETLILWPPDVMSWLIGKDPDAGKDWGQEEKGTTEDEMGGWYHQLNGHEFG